MIRYDGSENRWGYVRAGFYRICHSQPHFNILEFTVQLTVGKNVPFSASYSTFWGLHYS